MTTRRALITILALVQIALASSILACNEERIAKLAGVAVSRCLNREVTLSFDGPVLEDGARTFVTINDADAKRMYEALRPYYEKKGGAK